MADDQDKVSREAHDRMTRERDELKAQVDELTKVVKDVGYRDKARQYFMSKGVKDPDWAAEFALPHLRTVELDSLEETLASDRFAPLVQMASVQDAPASKPPEEATDPPPVPTPSGFSGPNPGAQGGPSPTPQKMKLKDVQGMTREQLQEADAQGLIDWSSDDGQPIAISQRFTR